MRENAKNQEWRMVEILEFKTRPKWGVLRGKTEDSKIEDSSIKGPKIEVRAKGDKAIWLSNFRDFMAVSDHD